LASRDQKIPKKALKDPNEDNKFYILDGTKHDRKNFGILQEYQIISNFKNL
jgi:hypothetical protein